VTDEQDAHGYDQKTVLRKLSPFIAIEQRLTGRRHYSETLNLREFCLALRPDAQ